MITLQPMNIQSAAADLLWSRVLKTYPDLRIALSEGGTGWIPYFLDRLDRTYEMHRAWTQQDFGAGCPARCSASTSSPASSATRSGCSCGKDRRRQHRLGGRLPPQRLDVAHRPRGADRGVRANAVTDDEIRKITHENAMRWYSFDPFAHVPRDQATVGARGGPRPPGTTCRSCPQHPGAHPGREARRLPPPGPAGRGRGAVSTVATRQMALVGFMQAGNVTVYAGSWRHPATEHGFLTPALPEARAHPGAGLLRHDVLRRPAGDARHLRRVGGRRGAPAPGRSSSTSASCSA